LWNKNLRWGIDMKIERIEQCIWCNKITIDGKTWKRAMTILVSAVPVTCPVCKGKISKNTLQNESE